MNKGFKIEDLRLGKIMKLDLNAAETIEEKSLCHILPKSFYTGHIRELSGNFLD